MRAEDIATDYAPAERAALEQIQAEAVFLAELPLFNTLLDSIPDIVVALNEQRQIVFANQALADAFKLEDKRAVYGLRPGEALDCIHSCETESGCGTTRFCRTCGAVNAILSGLRGKKETRECRITQRNGTALDLRVTATPFYAGQSPLVIFVATDISHEKRRQVLERAFFHDIQNTLSTVMGCTELLPWSSPEEREVLIDQLSTSVYRLREEMNSHKGLIAAENGELFINSTRIHSLAFLGEVLNMYRDCQVWSLQCIQLDEGSVNVELKSDRTLLARIIGNMLKNALEASGAGDRVTAGCSRDGDNHVSFWVHNDQSMPPDVQLQVFNRSFSTKGEGRGIGAYSMRLLAEQYLGGKVSFTTSPEQGTVFRVTLPLPAE